MFLLATGYLVALFYNKAAFRPSLYHIRYFAISGLFGFVLPLGATVFAFRHISAGEIVLIESLSPTFTIGFAMVLRTERVSRRRIGDYRCRYSVRIRNRFPRRSASDRANNRPGCATFLCNRLHLCRNLVAH